ncbi:MAG TPA: hypothetical protein VK826_00535 [Bacteroidia bacterium]|nr:hypothetical protein [Bacteroidia bacterium]
MIHYTTEVEIAGIIIRDPITSLTNLAIFGFGFAFFRRLHKRGLSAPHKNWKYFFLLLGISSLIGVIVHGLSYYTTPQVHFNIWWVMSIVQGAGVSFAQFGVGSNIFHRNKAAVAAFVIAQFLAFAISMYAAESFAMAKIHIAVGLIPIMIYYIFQGMKAHKAEILVATGIGVSAFTAVIHGLKISVSQWFNYNDISHVLIVVSLVLMYRGVNEGLVENNPATSES